MRWWWRGNTRVYGDHRGPSRRTFLRAGAATLALPLLPSALPRESWADPGEAPRRLLFYYVPNGMQMEWWTPEQEGATFTLPSILEPLEPVRDAVSVLSGLSNLPAQVPVAGDHARGTGSFLTCRTVLKTDGAGIENGISVDQVAAQALGSDTTLPSLQLGMTGGASVGNCDSGYSCAYLRNISWAGPSTPLPKMTDPRLVYERLFAGMGEGLPPEEVERQRLLRLSVVDVALGEANALRPSLGRTDQLKLDEYLDGLRALEVRIDGLADAACTPPAAPEPGLDFVNRLDTMHELMTVALQCDLTRVVSFMLGNGASTRSYADILGVPGAHHQLSHHQGDPETLERLRLIGRWEVEQFTGLLQRMAAIDEGGCSMLDNSAVYFASEIADGNSHSHRDLPVLLAGRGGGVWSPGRHIRYADDTPMANLYLAMLQTFGVFEPSFGDSTGVLEGL